MVATGKYLYKTLKVRVSENNCYAYDYLINGVSNSGNKFPGFKK